MMKPKEIVNAMEVGAMEVGAMEGEAMESVMPGWGGWEARQHLCTGLGFFQTARRMVERVVGVWCAEVVPGGLRRC
jgi:hypothetical protein